ncbi:transposase, partial [Acinetobacter baumannii]|nr:transposase [Acinetobacter baumannii]
RVAWLHEGYGKSVFEIFCNALSEEEQNAIEVVAGDGARWIDDCTKKYFRKARRCIDFFHVVGWVNEALDKVRNSTRAQATRDVERMKNEFREA